MRKALELRRQALVRAVLALLLTVPAWGRHHKPPADLTEILAQMNEAAKHVKTVSANLDYTKVTVLVDDKATEKGQIFYHKGKNPEVRIDIQKPDQKVILIKKNKAEYYLPKINLIQEYNLEQRSELVQQFLLLGFGSEASELHRAYNVKYLGEREMEGDTTALLELLPHTTVARQLEKIQLWISEESWLPVQQEFFQSGGDYLVARYSGMKVNFILPAGTFELPRTSNTKRVKMN